MNFMYANMIKLHEVERALEGNSTDAFYKFDLPKTKHRFKGMDHNRQVRKIIKDPFQTAWSFFEEPT